MCFLWVTSAVMQSVVLCVLWHGTALIWLQKHNVYHIFILACMILEAVLWRHNHRHDHLVPSALIETTIRFIAYSCLVEPKQLKCDSGWWITFAIATASDSSNPSDVPAWPQSTEQTYRFINIQLQSFLRLTQEADRSPNTVAKLQREWYYVAGIHTLMTQSTL